MRVRWTTDAADDLVRICDYTAQNRPESARRVAQTVLEYWVVDPEIDVIRVYRRSGDRFDRAVELSAEAGDVLTTARLPGLEIPLREVSAA